MRRIGLVYGPWDWYVCYLNSPGPWLTSVRSNSLPLLRSFTAEKCPSLDLDSRREQRGCDLPMVLLGLFPRIFVDSHERLHR